MQDVIYCDGIFDLYHKGHQNHFSKLKQLHPGATLLVGIVSDAEATTYKRKPIFGEQVRSFLVRNHPDVDRVIENPPLALTHDFIEAHGITLVYHAFADHADSEKQNKYFQVPIELGIFREVEYTKEISTTKILSECKSWADIWYRKGQVDTTDLRLLNGYENTEFDPTKVVKQFANLFDVQPSDSVLEVGCGAGLIAQHIENPYVGTDLSGSLVSKLITCTGKTAIQCEASRLPFKDESFDYILCNGVFQYFEDKAYSQRALREFARVARKGIYIGSIRKTTHEQKLGKHLYSGPTTHLCHTLDEFANYDEIPTSYSPAEYFSVVRRF